MNDTQRQLMPPRSRPAGRNGSVRRRDRCSREDWGRELAGGNDSETGHRLPARMWMGLEYADGVVSQAVGEPLGGFARALADGPAFSRGNLK